MFDLRDTLLLVEAGDTPARVAHRRLNRAYRVSENILRDVSDVLTSVENGEMDSPSALSALRDLGVGDTTYVDDVRDQELATDYADEPRMYVERRRRHRFRDSI